MDNVALVFLVRETLGGGPVAFGLVSAAFGVGMISASLGLSIRRTSVAVTTLLIVAWLASGFGTVATGLAPVIVVAALAQAVGGFGNGLENIAADTLIQQAVPREMLGRVFGLVTTAAFGGSTSPTPPAVPSSTSVRPAPSSSSPAPASSPSPPTSGSPSATQHHRTTQPNPGSPTTGSKRWMSRPDGGRGEGSAWRRRAKSKPRRRLEHGPDA